MLPQYKLILVTVSDAFGSLLLVRHLATVLHGKPVDSSLELALLCRHGNQGIGDVDLDSTSDSLIGTCKVQLYLSIYLSIHMPNANLVGKYP